MGIFVCSFTATGKSTCGKKHKDIIDMESTHYKYIDCDYGEKSKATKRKLNPNYPANYFLALEKAKDKYKYILVSDEIVINWLRDNKLEYYQVYPNINLKEEYYNRCLNRGNSRQFADYLMQNWEDWIKGCKEDKFASKHIELQAGQYLEDILKG